MSGECTSFGVIKEMRDREARLFIEKVANPVEYKLQQKTLERRSKKVCDFLEQHPGINLSWLAQEVEHDRANLRKLVKGKKTINQFLLLKIEDVLSKYGLNVI